MDSKRDIASNGERLTRLTCLTCCREVPFTEGDLLDYLQNGWPRCCGELMSIARDWPGGVEAPRPADRKA